MRTLVVPECATVESRDTVESADESTFHCASEPASKSSAKYVPAATPDPKRLTDCGLSSALSLSVRVALRGPSALGVKVTATEQLAPAFSEAGQSFVWLKSATPGPLMSTPPSTSGPPPVFDSVMDWVGLAVPTVCERNANALGERLTTGAESPRPLRSTVCGLDGALSPITSDADLSPPLCGVKET
jgi:hypothetical protein